MAGAIKILVLSFACHPKLARITFTSTAYPSNHLVLVSPDLENVVTGQLTHCIELRLFGKTGGSVDEIVATPHIKAG